MKTKINLSSAKWLMMFFITLLMWQCKKDDIKESTPPTVVSPVPANAATGVAMNSICSATFSEVMDPSTITTTTFTLEQGSTLVSGDVNYAGSVATFTLAANLAASTEYKATITIGAKDLAGNALVNINVIHFTTGAAPDIALPTVVSSVPADVATGVAFNANVAVTFSEAIDPLTITASTFALKQGETNVLGAVTYEGLIATFNPAVDFAASTVYTATITAGTKDLAGNALASDYTFSFTTLDAADVVLPLVNSTKPINNAIGVVRNQVVSLTFSEVMNPLTINASTFKLMQGTTEVSGTVNYSGTTATFTASSFLLAETIYTATITSDAKDLAGNALANNTDWSFTTTAASPALAPVFFRICSQLCDSC